MGRTVEGPGESREKNLRRHFAADCQWQTSALPILTVWLRGWRHQANLSSNDPHPPGCLSRAAQSAFANDSLGWVEAGTGANVAGGAGDPLWLCRKGKPELTEAWQLRATAAEGIPEGFRRVPIALHDAMGGEPRRVAP